MDSDSSATDLIDIQDSDPTLNWPPNDDGPYLNAVLGKEIYNFFGNRVIEHTTSSGEVRAIKVRSRKDIYRTEADLMHYAATHGILAPRVFGLYRITTTYSVASALISERVPGIALDEVWSDLSDADKSSIKQQLKQQLTLMRECTQPFIGRLKRKPAQNVYSPIIISRRFGPFDNEEAFDEWCLDRLKCLPYSRWMWKKWLKRMRQKSPSKFVLTHGDLTPRNIMVDGSKVTGIIDWERGGFFPEYCEYAWAMKLCPEMEDWWIPVLKEILPPCSDKRVKFTGLVEEKLW